MFVDGPLVPPEKIARALLTSPGDPMPVGLTIEMFQLMTSWVKANGASRECSSLAMRCVILAWSETWTQNLMIEKCGQKPMKTSNGHNMQVFHGPVFDQQPRSKPTAYSTAGHATHLEGELWVQGAQVEAENFRTEHVLFFHRAELTKQNMEV